MKFLILVLSLFFLGCETPSREYDKTVFPHIEEFQKMTGVRLHNADYEVRFIDLDAGLPYVIFEVLGGQKISGFCNILTGTIYLDRDIWRSSIPLEREELLRHELGHCYFGIIFHNDAINEEGCPESIMTTYSIDYYCYQKYRHFYLQQLLNGQ